MLKREVIDAVRENSFNIWAVDNVDEGIEILTGVPAGEQSTDGGYPEGTVHYAVDQRLRALARTAKEFAGPTPGPAPSEEKEPAASVRHIED